MLRSLTGELFRAIDRFHNQVFGFRARDEDIGINLEGQRVKLFAAYEICHRRAFGAAANHLLERCADFLGWLFCERGVEVDPRATARLGQQDLSIQARRGSSHTSSDNRQSTSAAVLRSTLLRCS